jgi:hypothetical protein
MRSFRHIAIIITFFVALIASLFIIGAVSSRPPQESKIISEFGARRAAYEQVLTMLSQDEGVEGVASWGIRTTGSPVSKMPPDGGMPAKRYQEYLALLKEIGASAVSKEREPLEVRFLVWRSGFAGDSRHVVVCWLEREPSHTMPSLDAFYRTAKPRSPAYVHIDSKWYIWADW